MTKKLIFVLFSLVLLTACSNNLPPNPDSASFSAPLGKATEIFEGYAEPTTFYVNPELVAFSPAVSEADVEAKVEGDQYVYKYGYVYNGVSKAWDKFSFVQPTVGLSNWIKGYASQTLKIKRDDIDFVGVKDYKAQIFGADDAVFSFYNSDGKEVQLPVHLSIDSLYFGDGNDQDDLLLLDGDSCVGVFSVEECEGVQFLASGPDNIAHVFEVISIDTASNTFDLKDVTYGRNYADVAYVPNSQSNIDLTDLGAMSGVIQIIITDKQFTFVKGEGGALTANGNEIKIARTAGEIKINSGNSEVKFFAENGVLSLSDIPAANVYIIAYACSKEGEIWNCHENKWMLRIVKAILTEVEELPPEPGAIGVSSVSTCNQVDGISAVCFLTKLNEPFSAVKSVLTESDTPTYLADGKYIESEGDNKNNADYIQYLNLTGNSYPAVVRAQDDDLAPIEGDYLYFKRSDLLWDYNLYFYDAVNFNPDAANDDFVGTTLTILGKVYTIVEAEAILGVLDKLTLLSGEAMLWLSQNQPIIKTINNVEHTVEVLAITSTEDACQIKVDDVTTLIDVGETKMVNGVQVGIVDGRAIHTGINGTDPRNDTCTIAVDGSAPTIVKEDNIFSGVKVLDVTTDADACQLSVNDVAAIVDVGESRIINDVNVSVIGAALGNQPQYTTSAVCQLAIGATEIKLTNNAEVRVDDVEIDGSKTVISSSSGLWTGLTISLTPKGDTLKDDLYLSPGGQFADPIFGVINYNYLGPADQGLFATEMFVSLGLPSEPTTPVCTDSDGGKYYYEKGYCAGNSLNIDQTWGLEDSCINADTLKEYYCNEDGTYGYQIDYYNCTYGCGGGACLREMRFDIADIWGVLGNISAKVSENNTPAEPSEGFAVDWIEYYRNGTSDIKINSGVAQYLGSYWRITFVAPKAPGTYIVKVSAKCAANTTGTHCMKYYNSTVTDTIEFTVAEAPKLADLVPVFVVYKQNLTEGETFIYSVRMTNAGETDTGIFNLRWFVDGTSAGYGSYHPILANQSDTSELTWTAVTGIHNITFIADVDNHIKESNENNNQKSLVVYVAAKSYCGNGVINAAEQCDDGNAISLDGCSSNCTVETGWACTGSVPTVCSPICGDGLKRGTEGCDDGNVISGDNCSNVCQIE